jgi:hypothetical protein
MKGVYAGGGGGGEGGEVFTLHKGGSGGGTIPQLSSVRRSNRSLGGAGVGERM